jgi:hypothetical protein
MKVALEAFDCRLAFDELRIAPCLRLLDVDLLLTFRPRLALSLGEDLLRLLLRIDERFLPPRFGVALRVLGEAHGVLFGAANRFGGDPFAIGNP